MSYCTDLLYGQGLTLCFPKDRRRSRRGRREANMSIDLIGSLI